ncbi:putative amino-acid-binding protein YxeM [Halomonadaceae bacterium LMG 33818]|uniref:amino acid ABC transporter substrate-binding protein n=1 Tax=Cernens ardua TaxID=3402176 RepID=UPI003EDBD59E
MKKLLAVITAGLLLTSPLMAKADTIRVGMSGGYYPYTFENFGKLQGFEVDLMNAIGQKLGDNVQFVTASFSGLAGMLDAGRIDTIANQITITPERKAKYLFSTPYIYDGAQLAVKNSTNNINSPADLSGKSVGVNLGSNFEQLLQQLPNAKQINIRTYDSGIEQDVVLGRLNAFVMDRSSIARIIKMSHLPLKMVGQPFSIIENAYPFRKNAQGEALKTNIDKALAQLQQDGTLAKLSEKWLGSNLTDAPESAH